MSEHNNENEQEISSNTDCFSNKQIFAESITTEPLDLIPLSPKYRLMNMSYAAVFGIALAIVLTIASSGLFFYFPSQHQPLIYIGYAIIALITFWNLTYHFLADPLKMYALREHDMNYQSGLLFKSLVSQPILRIQHIELKRGPIERKFGLATLQVFSAGGASYTFYIPGLEYQHAVQLRQFILDHKDLAADV